MRTIIITIFLSYACSLAWGQQQELSELEEHEQILIDAYIALTDCIASYDDCHPDALDSVFAVQLSQLVQAEPTSFDYAFERLQATRATYPLEILLSDDSQLKIYHWYKLPHTSMVASYTVYQFKDAGKTYTYWEKQDAQQEEIVPQYSQPASVYTVLIEGKPHYFIIKNTRLSANDITQSIECLTINEGQLKREVPVFKTRTKTFGSIDFNFLRTTITDDRDALNLIAYDENKQQILIPVVNESMEVKTSYLVYQLRGKYFEYIGIQK